MDSTQSTFGLSALRRPGACRFTAWALITMSFIGSFTQCSNDDRLERTLLLGDLIAYGVFNTCATLVTDPPPVRIAPGIPVNGDAVSSTVGSDFNLHGLDVISSGSHFIWMYPNDNVTLDLCGEDQVTILARGVRAASNRSTMIRYDFAQAGSYVLSTRGQRVTDYKIKAVNTAVFGGGSCADFDATLMDECFDFPTDFENASGFCAANLMGTFSTSACPTANRVGRCTGLVSTIGGIATFVGYSGDFAGESALRASCAAGRISGGSTGFLYENL